MRRNKAKKRKNRLNIEKRMRAKHNRHEQRKKRKRGDQSQWVENKFGEVVPSPHIAAMFGLLMTRRRRSEPKRKDA